MFLKIKVKYLSVIFSFLCFGAFAQLAPRDAAYYQGAGAFKNPEFVERGVGWEVSGCAAGLSYSSTIPFAERFASVTCVAETLLIRQCTSKFSDLSGSYLAAYSNVKVDASSSNVYWKVTDGTNDIYSKTLTQDDSWHAIQAPPFFAGGTENCIEVESEASFTGTVYLTKANIKQDFQMSVMGSLNDVDTDFIPYTPTLTGFGAATGVDFSYKRVGDSIIIRGSFAAGTPTGVEARASLPSGLVIKTGYAKNSTGTYFGDFTAAGKGGSVIATGGDAYLNFGSTDTFSDASVNPMTEEIATNVVGAGDGFTFTTTQIPIEGWQTGRTSVVEQKDLSPDKAGFLVLSTFSGEMEGHHIADGSCVLKSDYPDLVRNYKKPDGSYIYGECTVGDTDDGILLPDFTQDGGLFMRSATDSNPVGTFQEDMFESHSHDMTSNANNGNAGTASPYSSAGAPSYTNKDDIQATGGIETRPVNMAVTVYVRMLDRNKIIGKFKDTQIKKAEDKFVTDETEWGTWNDKQLYRRCFDGSIANGTALLSGVSIVTNAYGSFELNSTTTIHFPYDDGTNTARYNLNPTTGAVVFSSSATFDAQFCLEYTK